MLLQAPKHPPLRTVFSVVGRDGCVIWASHGHLEMLNALGSMNSIVATYNEVDTLF